MSSSSRGSTTRASGKPSGALFALCRFVALALSLWLANAAAQDTYPSRPVKLIVSSSPAGGTDVYARLLAQTFTTAFKQQFIVENRAGGNGAIAAELVARAVADGTTLLVTASPSIITGPALFKHLPYDADRDFAPVTRGALSPLALVIAPNVPARTLAEFLALARLEEGKLPYGSAGAASTTHLGVRLLEEAAGVKFLHIPYKGIGAATQDFLGGSLKFMLADLASVTGYLKSGKAIALAVNPPSSLLTGVPSFAEAGYPAVDVNASFMLVAPSATPKSTLNRLSSELMRAAKSAPLADRLEAAALIQVFDTPDEASDRVRKERAMWAAFIKRNNITVEQ